MTWKTMLAALTIGITATALAPRDAEALPANEVHRIYFSDASMTNEVGYKFLTSCWGVVNQLEGSTSAHYVTLSESCSSGSGSQSCYSHGRPISCPATICQSVPEFC